MKAIAGAPVLAASSLASHRRAYIWFAANKMFVFEGTAFGAFRDLFKAPADSIAAIKINREQVKEGKKLSSKKLEKYDPGVAEL